MIGLIDYGRGNLRSVEKALERVGAQVRRLDSPDGFANVSAVVLPGVGAFGDAMHNLEERRLVRPILDWLGAGKPFLGICLGYQLLFESSEETPNVAGLGWAKGKVVRFQPSVGKVPHMGWNNISVRKREGSILSELPDKAFFYHVHSYYPADVTDADVACETEYGGVNFASGITRGNIFAFQFHPEKSQENGRVLLQAFVNKTK